MPHIVSLLTSGYFDPEKRGQIYFTRKCKINLSPFLSRGHQLRITPHKDLVSYNSLVFFPSVVIAGDRPGADVDPAADLSIPKIGKVIGLGALSHHCLLDLYIVPYPDILSEDGPRPQVRKWPHLRSIANPAFLDDAGVFNRHSIPDLAVCDPAVRIDNAELPYRCIPLDHRPRIDRHIPCNRNPGINIDGPRIYKGDTIPHVILVDPPPHHAVHHRKFTPAIHADKLLSLPGLLCRYLNPLFKTDLDAVRQVEFSLGILGPNLMDRLRQKGALKHIGTGVYFFDLFNISRGILVFNDLMNRTVSLTHNPPISSRVFNLCREDGYRGASLLMRRY